MAQQEENIINAGGQVIWVLEQDRSGVDGTAESCRSFMNGQGSDNGICVGDAQTMPTPGTFDDSPFALARGFDIIVQRSTMKILWVSTHGTTAGNDNLTGEEVLAAVRGFTGR